MGQNNEVTTAAELSAYLDKKRLEGTLALHVADGTGSGPDNDDAVNTAASYAEKTLAIAFTADADVTSRQMLFEQGGTVRGINAFIENGKLHMAVWNNREERWGYKELSADVDSGGSHTATLVFDGAKPADGSVSMYLDGALIGSVGGVGLLYRHPGQIGIGQVNDNTVIDGRPVRGELAFKGEVAEVVQLNEALSGADLAELHSALGAGDAGGSDFLDDVSAEGGLAFYFDDPQTGRIANDREINSDRSYDEKTLSISFTTGEDVTERQMIYEQGGGIRGINVFIEDGKLFMAVWNNREERWGYKELSAEVASGDTYTATLVFDGVKPADGTVEMYLDGALVGSADGVGLLYRHTGWIGIGKVAGNSFIQGKTVTDTLAFKGEINKILQLNDAVDAEQLDALHEFMGVAPGVIEAADDAATVQEDGSVVIDVQANDIDRSEEGITIDGFTQPENGTVSLNEDGTLTYVPDSDFFGRDSFTYTIAGGGQTDTALVTLTVDAVNDRPVVGVETRFTVAEDLAVGETVGRIDASDVDGDVLSYSITGGNEDGLFAVDEATGEIYLTGDLDFETDAQHALSVAVSDGVETATGTVTVDVTDVEEGGPPPEDKQNIVVILDSGDRSQSPDYLKLVDSYDVYDREPDAEGLHPHGKAVEKSVYDMVGGDGDTQIVHLKIANNSSSAGAYTSTIRDGFQYVIDNLIDAYDVVSVNLSYGGGVTNSAYSYFNSQFNTLLNNGTMVTVSAGNSGSYGTNRLANAEQRNVLNVAATDLNGRHASYSNEGDFTDYYAVGESYWHSDADNTSSISKMRGTSFSSPQVSGLVAKVQELAEDTFDRLLSVDEVLQTFDNVTDTITGKFTGELRNFLNYDGVVKSFSDLFDVSVAVDEIGDTKLLYRDGAYALETADGKVIDITRDGAVLDETMSPYWDAYQIEDNAQGGYTLVFRDKYGDDAYRRWDLDADGAFIAEKSLDAAGVRAAEQIVGFDLNNDLMIETADGRESVFADRSEVQSFGADADNEDYLAAAFSSLQDDNPAVEAAVELARSAGDEEWFATYLIEDEQTGGAQPLI